MSDNHLRDVNDDVLAELTDAAYRVALRHGLKGSFLEAELELWEQLRRVLSEQAPADAKGVRCAAAFGEVA